ncbi:MAG: SAM-dependent methyltransferase [Spirochaetaceae bacterium]|nr:SAM-dependent methyltransferase [Spirochaetaceae bacterium]
MPTASIALWRSGCKRRPLDGRMVAKEDRSMYSFQKHYSEILSTYYTRIYGGLSENLAKARRRLSSCGLESVEPAGSRYAADLGAGSGFFSIPLAELGYSVLAMDLDEALLDELATNAGSLSIEIVKDDILNIAAHSHQPLDLILCMTDTLAHLESEQQLMDLLSMVYENLSDDGQFLVSFRDQSNELKGTDRFIPFYSDRDLIATTFVDFSDSHVEVTDILYTTQDDTDQHNRWNMYASSYRKLRMRTGTVLALLQSAGFRKVTEQSERGMTFLQCKK